MLGVAHTAVALYLLTQLLVGLRQLIVYSFLTLPSGAAPILVGKSMSQTLHQPKMIRAAVANSKILKIRNLGTGSLLLTGLRFGTTMIRTWTQEGIERSYIVKVVEPEVTTQDQRTYQEGVVKVSMEFIEVDLSHARELGIRWPGSIEFSGSLHVQGSYSTSGLNFSTSAMPAKAYLNLLHEEGVAKTFANPELFVRLGEPASFHSGGEVPIPTASESFGRYFKRIEWKTHGLSIQVRPTSDDGYRIRSDIKVDISELSRETAVEGVPGFNRRKIETKMESVDGGTVILSALLKQTTSEKQDGIPLLSSIPLLGYLFSSKAATQGETELIAAITFSILNSERENERLERLRHRFNG